MRLKLKQMQYLAKQIAFNVEKTGKQYSFWGDFSCNVTVYNNLASILDEIAHEFTNLVNKKLVLLIVTPEVSAAFFARKSVVGKSYSMRLLLEQENIRYDDYVAEEISKGKNHSVTLFKKSEESV